MFVLCSNSQIYGEDLATFCGLLRIYELYPKNIENFKSIFKEFVTDYLKNLHAVSVITSLSIKSCLFFFSTFFAVVTFF